MKTAVLYKSKTGYTKKYAEWIAEELSADMMEAKTANVRQLADYDVIVYGGTIVGGMISGASLVSKSVDQLRGKKLILFGTGMMPYDAKKEREYRASNLPLQNQENVGFYYFRGGINVNALNPAFKIILGFVKKTLEGKENKTEEEAAMVEAFDRPTDYTNRESIYDLIAFAKAQ